MNEVSLFIAIYLRLASVPLKNKYSEGFLTLLTDVLKYFQNPKNYSNHLDKTIFHLWHKKLDF